MNDKGKEFISQLKLYTDYMKWDESKNRYETWEEACDSVLGTHILHYGEKIQPYIDEVKSSYYAKEFLSSQRNLQFRGKDILKNHARLYNCCVTYAYSPDIFSKGLFVLLAGTGLGVSLKQKFVSQLPKLTRRDKGVKMFSIPDSTEGWSEAVKVLISSYCKHPSLYKEFYKYQLKFDYSQIRVKGAFVTGGFKAPGPDGLRCSLELIENMYNVYLGVEEEKVFKSILAYDTFMYLSDAVLAGGVRRSAMNIVMDLDDTELINAKTGNWRDTHPHRARSNNSVGLSRHGFTKEQFKQLLDLNEGDNDLGFVFMSHEDDMFNPCFEIQFNYYSKIKDKSVGVLQFCNLTEINASACVDSRGRFSNTKFQELCRKASIVGSLQAGYSDFPYLGKETGEIVAGEALLGVSITGWMTRPELFNKEILQAGAKIVVDTNLEVSKFLGTNQSARSTTVKPSGNASVILKTASGIHPEHSKRYFRVMQLNKDSETARYLVQNNPGVLENSVWSNTGTDYVVYTPCENPEGILYKEDMQGVKHLKLIELVQKYWVSEGKVEELCYMPTTNHNVSNTVIVDNREEIVDYIFENQDNFSAVSFLSMFGDKDYAQAPFTSVLNTEELVKTYGDGVMFMAGLIVDGIHHFNGDLWVAAKYVQASDTEVTGTREQVLLRKDWIRRVKQFSKNYFKGDLNKTIYCMKDVHLWHKWNTITRNFKLIDYGKILTQPNYINLNTMGAVSCSGTDGCEIQ